MHTDLNVLYEDFQRARQAAMEVTDRFYDLRPDDPRRPEVWDVVVRQTETARQLLERWLQGQPSPEIQPIATFGSPRVRGVERR
jgi:hypothetical protein